MPRSLLLARRSHRTEDRTARVTVIGMSKRSATRAYSARVLTKTETRSPPPRARASGASAASLSSLRLMQRRRVVTPRGDAHRTQPRPRPVLPRRCGSRAGGVSVPFAPQLSPKGAPEPSPACTRQFERVIFRPDPSKLSCAGRSADFRRLRVSLTSKLSGR